MELEKGSFQLSDLEIRDKLVEKDPMVTRWFFSRKCRPLFVSIIHRVFNYGIDYDEFVNEVYVFLMEDNAHRFRTYDGTGSIFNWMKRTVYRYIIKHEGKLINDEVSMESSLPDQADDCVSIDAESARMDVESMLSLLAQKNERAAYVLRRSMLDEAEPEVIAAELKVKVSNLYNIKARAIALLGEIALGSSIKTQNK
ncbi:MAG: sigma-70 family RNA polymerase sigma factor [Bacteroidales bacterium]|nr:sigma-70 family RNA polymerase sigma factor [Bacteroidales bacterium]